MAKLDYFHWYNRYIEYTEALSDKELGRLVRALTKYHATGEITELTGNERFLFPTMKQEIDKEYELAEARKLYGLKGELHPNWKGGITPENQKERSSKKYAEWRNAVFERDDYTCQICHARGGKLNAHHISKWSTDKENRYNIENGVTLCEECHKALHRKR